MQKKGSNGFECFYPSGKNEIFFGQTIEYLGYLILLTDDWNCVWTQVYLIQIWEQRNNFVIFCFLLWKQKKNGTLWMSYILANIFFKLQIKNVLFDNKIQLSENLIDDILAKMTDANRDGKYKYACWFILWRKIKRRMSVISCKVRDSWKFILVLASLIAVTFEIFA